MKSVYISYEESRNYSRHKATKVNINQVIPLAPWWPGGYLFSASGGSGSGYCYLTRCFGAVAAQRLHPVFEFYAINGFKQQLNIFGFEV